MSIDPSQVVSLIDEGLSNSSYLVDLGDGRALAVDPSRDVRAARVAAVERGLWIAFVADTQTGTTTAPFVASWVDEAITLLRSRLTAEVFNDEWQRGQELTLDEAVEGALSELATCGAGADHRPTEGGGAAG